MTRGWINDENIASIHLLSMNHCNMQSPYIWRRIYFCMARPAENVTSHYTKGYSVMCLFSSLQTMEEYMSKPAFWQQQTWWKVTKGKEKCLRSVGCVLHSGRNFSSQVTDFIHEGCIRIFLFIVFSFFSFSVLV